MKRIPHNKPTSIMPKVESPTYKPLSSADIRRVPERAIVMEDMLTVAWVEVGRLKKKQDNGLVLQMQEIRTLTGLMDAVTKLSKEQREAEKGLDPGNLTDEEYLDELLKAAEALKEKILAKRAKEGSNAIKNNSK